MHHWIELFLAALGLFPFLGFITGGRSSSRSRRQDLSGPVTATEGRASAQQQGDRSAAASEGGVAAGPHANIGGITASGRANIGGYQLGNIGQGATVNISAADNGATQAAYQSAQDSIERIVRGQAETTAAVVGQLGNLNESRESRTEDDVGGLSTTAAILIGVAALIGTILALAFILKRKA